jgi:hypothetical protein
MRLATRSGLSLPRSECPFQDHLYGITVPLPASSLPPGAVPDPFGRGLLPSVPVSREPGRDHRLQPVAWLTLRSPASPQALLPFGTRPSGSPLGSIRRRGAYFSKRPVTFRSPPAATCYSTADGSTFQARLRLSKLAVPSVIPAGCVPSAEALFLQPMAFRSVLLRMDLPAVLLFPAYVGTFRDEVSFRPRCAFPEGRAAGFRGYRTEVFCFLKPCDSVVVRTFPVSCDSPYIRDWSGTRFP